MSDFKISNYHLNKQGYSKIPKMTDKSIQEKQDELEAWLSSIEQLNYIGLLCRELNDYTVFNIHNYNVHAAAAEIISLLQDRGEILDIVYERHDYGDSYQCWISAPTVSGELMEELNINSDLINSQVFMYMLFDAHDWVIEV